MCYILKRPRKGPVPNQQAPPDNVWCFVTYKRVRKRQKWRSNG